jgi:hypothetical protein
VSTISLGTASPLFHSVTITGTGTGYFNSRAGDLNGDGLIDLAIGSHADGAIRVLYGYVLDGSGNPPAASFY